jgi:hypothetical protein
VVVRGGWRLYSSGPGLFLHTVRACLLGVREAFGDVVFDPGLPHSLDGVRRGNFGPSAIVLNGVQCVDDRPRRKHLSPRRVARSCACFSTDAAVRQNARSGRFSQQIGHEDVSSNLY